MEELRCNECAYWNGECRMVPKAAIALFEAKKPCSKNYLCTSIKVMQWLKIEFTKQNNAG